MSKACVITDVDECVVVRFLDDALAADDLCLHGPPGRQTLPATRRFIERFNAECMFLYEMWPDAALPRGVPAVYRGWLLEQRDDGYDFQDGQVLGRMFMHYSPRPDRVWFGDAPLVVIDPTPSFELTPLGFNRLPRACAVPSSFTVDLTSIYCYYDEQGRRISRAYAWHEPSRTIVTWSDFHITAHIRAGREVTA